MGNCDCACFFFQAEDGIRDLTVTGVQTCALPIWRLARPLSDERSERARTAWALASWPCVLLVKSAAAGTHRASSRRAGLQRMRVRPMTIPRFRPPQQTRSQETLDRILDAAERVLDEKSFTEATLAEIMERAGVTVGAFYRRFPDKDALLHLLDERFFPRCRRAPTSCSTRITGKVRQSPKS